MISLRGGNVCDYTDDNGNSIKGRPQTSNGSVVEFHGKNCQVTFEPGAKMHGAIVLLRDNSTVHIGRNSLFRGRMTLGLGCAVTFGNDIYCGIDLQVTTAEGANVTLGSDLLIANNVRIRADDSHPIYDGVTGQRINPAMSVTVGNHVWIGQETFLMPGSSIGSGSVIGARSMVTKSRPVPENVIAIGSPAKVQRRKIHWVRKHLQTSTDVPIDIPSIFEPDDLPTGKPSLLAQITGMFR
ncbi:acyltransferase [Paenarthrobacter ureafaciens]|uniref:acyltransferase n=1 Tax=Paenarthrobacter ureafaciens TaxID=37931 RepID=UPI00140C56CA|nr:acyltransferase [Paenarthrobacter ureafaciens]